MLQRTVRSQRVPIDRRRWRPVLAVAAPVLAVGLFYALLPKPGPRLRDVQISDNELRTLVQTMRLPAPDTLRPQFAAKDETELRAAKFGKVLFGSTASVSYTHLTLPTILLV